MPTFPDPGVPPVPPALAGKLGGDLPSAVRYARGLLWPKGAIYGVNLSGGIIAGFILLPAIAGGGLSLAAALGLMRSEARRYFADPGAAANAASDGDLDGNTGYSAVRPATVISHLRWGADAAACQAW